MMLDVQPRGRMAAIFQRQGDYWTMAFAGVTVQLQHLAGFTYLAFLLRHPDQEFHIFDLLDASQGTHEPLARSRGDAGDVLDEQAHAAYRARLVHLHNEVAVAEQANDLGHAARARAEIDALTRELARGVGLGGRRRKAASAAERARVNIAKRISVAHKRIARHHPALAHHLAATIRTGTFCVYRPDPSQPVRWET